MDIGLDGWYALGVSDSLGGLAMPRIIERKLAPHVQAAIAAAAQTKDAGGGEPGRKTAATGRDALAGSRQVKKVELVGGRGQLAMHDQRAFAGPVQARTTPQFRLPKPAFAFQDDASTIQRAKEPKDFRKEASDLRKQADTLDQQAAELRRQANILESVRQRPLFGGGFFGNAVSIVLSTGAMAELLTARRREGEANLKRNRAKGAEKLADTMESIRRGEP